MTKKSYIMVAISVASIIFGSLFYASIAVAGSPQHAFMQGNPFDALWDAFSGLESRIEALEEQPLPQQGFLTAPAFDSGWESVGEGGEIVFAHDLGTTEVFVYLVGRDIDDTLGIHQYEYAGMYWAYWHKLDSNNISVTAYPGSWDEVRVMIWRIPEQPT